MRPARALWAPERSDPRLVRIVAALFVLDALLLTAHLVHRSGFAVDPESSPSGPLRTDALWNGGVDGSLLEFFGLLQLGAAAVLLVREGLRDAAQGVLAAWGGVLLLLVADDLFRLHERVGARLGLDRLAPSLGTTTAQELGGLLFWAVSGLVLAGGLIRLHRASPPSARSASRGLLSTVAPFALVAVGYVMVGALRPGLMDGPWGDVAALVRITVKLMTMTLLLVRALQLREGGSDRTAAPPRRPWAHEEAGQAASSLSTATPCRRSFL